MHRLQTILLREKSNNWMTKILILGGCGYIGSALQWTLTQGGYSVDSVDQEIFGNPARVPSRRTDYRTLPSDAFEPYSHVILLAAHSSVRMALDDPSEAFRNNIVGFQELLEKLGKQTLIYASSSSVYSGVGGNSVDETWNSFSVGNIYDFSKYANDCLAGFSDKNAVGLRFGTVSGASPNMRTDIMINRMTLTALRDGTVNIANPHVYRPILGLSDLCRAVRAIISHDVSKGVYNLASFNASVEQVGQAVAGILNVPVRYLPNSPTYDFSMLTHKVEKQCGFRFEASVESLVAELKTHYERHGLSEHAR